ncbi:MAG: MXAN_6577-like cysteine-rich protein [Myxococcota bacterium]|nr:MXAN_6577-like cysteine-rich protein [Myxococcota bacterium]
MQCIKRGDVRQTWRSALAARALLLVSMLFAFVPLGCGTLSELSLDLKSCAVDADCPDTQHCVMGYCVEQADLAAELDQEQLCGAMSCPEGYDCCGTVCVDLASSCSMGEGGEQNCRNLDNCGLCGRACESGETCVDGACLCGAVECPASQGCCDERCVDLFEDLENCGACGRVCEGQTDCFLGRCECLSFTGGSEPCGPEQSCCPSNGCFRLDDDPRACGACGSECQPGERCVEGQCVCGEDGNETQCTGGQSCCQGSCVASNAPACVCGDAGLCGVGEGCCLGSDGEPSCVDLATSSEHCGACGVVCAEGSRCEDRRCVAYCPPGRERCDERCVELNSDPEHCGACANACPEGAVCAAGVCVSTCPVGFVDCDGACVQTGQDVEHCGGCGLACDGSEVCSQGLCKSSCEPGESNCGGDCIDLVSNRLHCGTCFNSCVGGLLCQGGKCSSTCDPNWFNCGGSCVQLDRDRNHCGSCGNQCASGEICQGGVCRLSCPSGQLICGGSCVDPLSDSRFCGARSPCDTANRGEECEEGELCLLGRCEANCGGGLINCGGLCVDVQNNPSHCGTCGTDCSELPHAPNSYCSAGACKLRCAAGFGNCNQQLADGCESSLSSMSHCGACGKSCPTASGVSCSGGQCVLSCSSSTVDCNDNLADGCETNSSISLNNCGGCGRVCASYPNASRSCDAGQCTAACLSGFANCDSSFETGCETELSTSAAHCGQCHRPCTNEHGESACVNGECVLTLPCEEGWDDCDGDPWNGCETALNTPEDCGACGLQCGLGANCEAQLCVCPDTSGSGELCPVGHHCIGDSCFCGFGEACSDGEPCVGGLCR